MLPRSRPSHSAGTHALSGANWSAITDGSIEMLLVLGFVLDHLGLVAILAGLAVLVKVMPITLGSRVFGQGPAAATATAFLLAHIGEFSFVLQKVGATNGLSVAGRGEDGDQAFIATAVVLVALTPALYQLAVRAGRRMLEREAAARGQVEQTG